eukprot:228012_1
MTATRFYISLVYFWSFIYSCVSQVTTPISRSWNIDNYNEQSYTTTITSTLDDGMDAKWEITMNFATTKCINPRLTVTAQNTDGDGVEEKLNIYGDFLFTTSIATCMTAQDSCGTPTFDECLTDYTLANGLVSSLQIGILKDSSVNLLCTYSLNVNLTFTCGTSYIDDLSIIIDRTQLSPLTPTPTSSPYEYYNNHISSEVGDSEWAVYNASFNINGISCYQPAISFTFVEHDFNSPTYEWYEVYSPVSSNLTRCTASLDGYINCDTMPDYTCMTEHVVYEDDWTGYDTVYVYILKSYGVNTYCGAAINGTVTLRCTTKQYDINRTIDLTGIDELQPISNTLSRVHSTVPLIGTEVRYDVNIQFINGSCYNPRVSMIFSEVDYNSVLTEWLDVYTHPYATTLWDTAYKLARCPGTKSDCTETVCLTNRDIAFSSSSSLQEFHVGLWQGVDVNEQGNCQGYSLDVEITISCGGSVEYIVQQFDMSGTTLHDITSYSIPIQYTSNAEQSFIYVTWNFMNGQGCYNPLLTFTFTDIDYDEVDEYIRIYYPSTSTYIAQCNGFTIGSCAIETCVDKYDLGAAESIVNTLTIGVAKTDDVHVQGACGPYSIDATAIIQCGGMLTMNPTANPTHTPTKLPTTLTFNPTLTPTKLPTKSPSRSSSFRNILISTHENITDVWIAFQVLNVDNSCGGTLHSVSISDSSHEKWINSTINLIGYYEFTNFNASEPFKMAIDIRLIKVGSGETIEIIESGNVIWSLEGGKTWDFKKNFCNSLVESEPTKHYSLLNYQYYVVMIIPALIVSVGIMALIDSKCFCRRNDYFSLSAIITALIQILDMLSDIFFAIDVWSHLKSELIFNGKEFQFISIFFLSIVFIIVPVIVSLFQLYFASEKHWLHNNRIRAWLSRYSKILYLMAVLSGSAFTAVELFNSSMFALNIFYMGLSKQYLLSFMIKKVYSIVLLENCMQLILSLWYMLLLGRLEFIPLASMIFSVISIIVAVITIILQKRIYKTQDYVYITIDITGQCILDNIKICENRIKNIKSHLCTSSLGVSTQFVEIMKPFAGSIQNGIQLQIHISYIHDKSNIDVADHYYKRLDTAIKNGQLQQIIMDEWKLLTAPTIPVNKIFSQFIKSKEKKKLSILRRAAMPSDNSEDDTDENEGLNRKDSKSSKDSEDSELLYAPGTITKSQGYQTVKVESVEMTQNISKCHECNNKANGRIDENDGCFYCNDCWTQFANACDEGATYNQ